MTRLWSKALIEEDGEPIQEFRRFLSSFGQAAVSGLGAEALHVCLCQTFTRSETPIQGMWPDPAPGEAAAQSPELITAAMAQFEAIQGGGPTWMWHRATADGLEILTIALANGDGRIMAVVGLMYRKPDRAAAEPAAMALMKAGEALLDSLFTRFFTEFDLMVLERRNARLTKLARIDRLTGLENATSFETKACERLRTTDEPAALVVIDVDHFKLVNDLYGHQFGDRYLKLVAESIIHAMPQGAIVGRIGGDEFAVCLDLPGDEAAHLSEILVFCRNAVMRAAATLDKPDLGRISMGAALFPSQAKSFRALFELADAGLYAAKRSGRSAYRIFDPSRHQTFNSRAMGQLFLDAIDQGRVVPFFQPIVDLDTGQPAYFEVLARWEDGAGGIRTPEDFATILSDYRFANILTETVVGQALEVAAQARQSGSRAKLSVNLCALDLTKPEFVFDMQALLAQHGAEWCDIVFEVTETTMLDCGRQRIFQTLAELRSRGAQVALDDFGMGYGGLRHLRDWPIDILKIDGSFVAGMDSNPKDRVIVEAILHIARQTGLTVIAEGIETEQQRQMLRDIGCVYGQGYLFSCPGPQGALFDMLGAASQVGVGAA
ncbi:putative bifunctional diguanylate cyclase/phosphodiesterase [Tropicibacter naphthalenivorans]|uniref:Cyclic di-GMP phosphodiesterase Gmr n=1 Tax=Tropicibacter naphthalenivorans TaxID=441103 RepID=A0A0P1GMN4_9RHOB|nr:bifunctional diguanylate cyclase/phosphodiesterase [Tropicibacter naphthalenivorans]CUH75895.1 Cyclic di-GMP phosphodiesterase Gmr [Tropicibacter naphthalenivorans]SMC41492.1 diguanylate cyclase (GGDEF) domain-containing protein [Tropicibacter naphthalenivorans]